MFGSTDTQDSLLASTATKMSQGVNYTLFSMRFWDVRMPPVKKHMVQGYLVPTLKGAVSRVFSKQRRISIEVYRPSEITHASINIDASAVQTQLFHQLLKGTSTNDIIAQEPKLQNDDICVLRVLKPKPTQANEGDDQEEPMLEHGDWGKSRTKTYVKQESKE